MSGMSANEVSSIKTFLKQQGIISSAEWIEACIEFLRQEHGMNLALSTLKNQVYQQWLDADLDEIGFPCLPLECSTAQKITLNGCFALQIQGIRDIGKSSYSQLKELEKTENSNSEFSAAPAADTPPWESKPTRMLLFQMTDGCTCVQGMEYKPLSSFSPNLPPGVKVLIQGPIDCRLGMMLLSNDKIKVLGGEIESKAAQFSRIAMLREILQLSPEENTNQPNTTETQTNTTPAARNVNNHQNTRTLSNSLQPRVSSSSNQPRVSHVTGLPSNASSGSGLMDDDDVAGVFEDDFDDFERSLDYDALDEIEQECIRQSQSRNVEDVEDDDVWQEDEDMVNELMNFQDENEGFETPHFPESEQISDTRPSKEGDSSKPFSYLSAILKDPMKNGVVTIKGFIITVLSKLECKKDQGWCLCVKVNDGTATLDVNMHDKILEGIIGIPASTMMKMQALAKTDPVKKKEVSMALVKCKTALQDFNCLMDIQFQPGEKPCIVKSYPVTPITAEQLLERVKATS